VQHQDDPERSAQASGVPAPLRAAAGLVLVEGLLVVGFAVSEAADTSSQRIVLGLSGAGFFLVYGLGLGWCAWGMNHLRPWSRGPVLLSQLILLGLAWSSRDAGATGLVVFMAVLAALVLAGLLSPSSIDALDRDEHRRHRPDGEDQG
jgi:hypothetical protein